MATILLAIDQGGIPTQVLFALEVSDDLKQEVYLDNGPTEIGNEVLIKVLVHGLVAAIGNGEIKGWIKKDQVLEEVIKELNYWVEKEGYLTHENNTGN